MDVCIHSVTGRRLHLSVQPNDTVDVVKQQLAQEHQLPEGSVSLFFEGKELCGDSTLSDSSVSAGSVLFLVLRAHGGVMMEPTLQVLARKYNCDKMVCRKCYNRLPPRAHNCRNKACGRNNRLRIKKKLK
eukprot:RCo009287